MEQSKNITLQPLKGMSETLPEDLYLWHFLEHNIRELMVSYGYDEIRLPVLERTELFKRSIGESTDIVEKEMFTFIDKDKEQTQLSMRPEGTASCVRACIHNGLIRNNQQQRLWYLGPMFRRERPQKGRLRQFSQLGVESFGFSDPKIEAEHLSMLNLLWKKLGISDVVTLEINSIGSLEARNSYKEELVNYLNLCEDKLDEDSKRRLKTKPLRVLDSKNPDMQDIIANAPVILDYLDEGSKAHFEKLQNELQALGINFIINPKIVRGLDYYSSVVYEWTTDKLGSQSAICAGGRYDSLPSIIGGAEAVASGFAMGLDRVVLLLKEMGVKTTKNLDCYIISVGETADKMALTVADKIRSVVPKISIMVNIGGGSFKSQFKRADKSGAKFALILGEEEIANGTASIKFLREQKEQLSLTLEDLAEELGGLCGYISN